MNTYKYIPPKIIKNAAIAAGVCSTIAALLLLMSILIGAGIYKVLSQVACVVFATIAIQITTRYILSNYIFILDDINFIIVRTFSKKSKQICNIKLNTAIEISKKTSFKEAEKKFGKLALSRIYCQNLWNSDEYTYIFEFDEKISAIKFDADDNFVNEMKLRIEEAKLRYGE